ncbi:MAG: AAA family ATPase, partial [Cyanobacteria bacterium P01_G01_bin.49]
AGLSTPASQYGTPPQDTSLPIYVRLEDKPRHPQFGKRTLVIRGLDKGQIGHIPEDEPQPPIMSFGDATFSYEQAKTLQATLDNGPSLKIGHLANYHYAKTAFENTPVALTLTSAVPKGRQKEVPGVMLEGQLLGLITDKTSQSLLKQQNLTQGSTFNASLTRKFYNSTVMVNLDPDAVQYSDRHITEKASLKPGTASRVIEAPEAILPQIKRQAKQQATLLSVDDNLVKVTVDHRKIQSFQDYFNQQQIPYEMAATFDKGGQEYALGYQVFYLSKETLSAKIFEQMVLQWGEPLDQAAYQNKLDELAHTPIEYETITVDPEASISASNPEQFTPQTQSHPESTASNSPETISPVGKPVAMSYGLRLHAMPNPLPVSTTIEAMRGHGRTHTTRTFEPYKAYRFKAGDLAIAYSGQKDNPTRQVLFRVGKQYPITDDMINDPNYRQQWAQVEKHSEQELDNFQGKQSWGLEFEPLGDYQNGRVFDFQSGEDITQCFTNNPKGYITQQTENLETLVNPKPEPSAKENRPTPQQQEGLDKMSAWSALPRDSISNNLFRLEGYAGTGKSFTVTQFVQQAKQQHPRLTIAYTGPTHEAVNVGRQLSEKLKIKFDDARTLHSLLKYRPGIDFKKNQSRFQGGKLSEDKVAQLPDLIIVDEVSQVNQEMYGLLKDLAERGKKILLVGDRAQIRPVNESRSLAFTDPDLTHHIKLTEVVRYSNQLGHLATALRTDQHRLKPPLTSSPDGTVVAQGEQPWLNNIINHFTSDEFTNNPNYFQVYAYSNARVNQLNKAIRNARFGATAPEYVEGEIIVADEPGRDINEINSIHNGQEMKVLHAQKLSPSHDPNHFHTWHLTVHPLNEPNNSFDIQILAAESQQDFQTQLKKLEKAWKTESNRSQKINLRKKQEEFKKQYNHISYNYARTYHKAQGKTKVKVAIDEQNINDSFRTRIGEARTEAIRNDLTQQMNELTYVASTRAQQQIFVHNRQALLPSSSQKPWYLPDTEWEKTQSNSLTSSTPPPQLDETNHQNPNHQNHNKSPRSLPPLPNVNHPEENSFPDNDPLPPFPTDFDETDLVEEFDQDLENQDLEAQHNQNPPQKKERPSFSEVVGSFNLQHNFQRRKSFVIPEVYTHYREFQNYIDHHDYSLLDLNDGTFEARPNELIQSQGLVNSVEVKKSEPDSLPSPQTTSFEPSNSASTSSKKFPLPLPLSEEFMPSTIALQQERTQKVAPIIIGFLEAKRLANAHGLNYNETSHTLSYKGKDNTITYNGQELQLIDNQSGQPKMIAQLQQDSNGRPSWLPINLPVNSPGLSEQDVNKFSDRHFVHTVKQALLDASKRSAPTQTQKLVHR